jgi:hypothetical protein
MADDKSLGGLAKKWLKAQSKELLARDRHERAAASVAGNRAEHELKEKATEEAIYTAVPGLRDFVDRQEAAKVTAAAERERRRDEEIAARPLAGVGIGITDADGVAIGSWSGQLPAKVTTEDEYEYLEDSGEERVCGQSLVVDLTARDDAVPVIANQPLLGWRFQIPGFTGPGTYDLTAVYTAREETGNGSDYTEFCFGLGGWDEPLYWTPYTGSGSVEVGADGKALVVRMTLEGASAGPWELVASVNLP